MKYNFIPQKFTFKIVDMHFGNKFTIISAENILFSADDGNFVSEILIRHFKSTFLLCLE